jgi:1-acyl-sn-glycerol-3-phosphate acyltransferase
MESKASRRVTKQDAVSRAVAEIAPLPARQGAVPGRMLGWLTGAILRAAGWHIEGSLPDIPRYVAIGAPHTSTWDLPIFLMAGAALSDGFTTVKIAWLGKHTAFTGPAGALFRKLGGIPVNRSAGHHVIKTVIQAFRASPRMALAIAPEGTRQKADYWKPGFYYIARLAKVPIVCGFLDYKRKVVGMGPLIYPTSDIEADMQQIREFYSQVTARHPERVGPIQLERNEIPS